MTQRCCLANIRAELQNATLRARQQLNIVASFSETEATDNIERLVLDSQKRRIVNAKDDISGSKVGCRK
jgi:hypothetical protein